MQAARERPRPGSEGRGEAGFQGPVGVAEFLDLAYVKPNTLGNTRMLRDL